jgi:deoxyhypusine synthase
MPSDYSIVMPFLVKALLDNRARYQKMEADLGADALFEKEPRARGYLRPREGYRLFDQREELTRRLSGDVRANREWLLQSINYPVAAQS